MIFKYLAILTLLIQVSFSEETIYGAYIIKRTGEVIYFKHGRDGKKHRVTKEEYEKNTKDTLPFFFTPKR